MDSLILVHTQHQHSRARPLLQQGLGCYYRYLPIIPIRLKERESVYRRVYVYLMGKKETSTCSLYTVLTLKILDLGLDAQDCFIWADTQVVHCPSEGLYG